MSRRVRVSAGDFPDSPGVYVVWDKQEGPPLYVGVAATQTIRRRWEGQTLQNRAGGSAIRRSLGVHLGLVEKKLSPTRDGTRYYPPEVERKITAFLLGCQIEFHPCATAAEARDLEENLISELKPRLNVRRPRVKRSPAEKEVLRQAKAFYRDQVKPAVLRGLNEVANNPPLDAKQYVVRLEDNLLPAGGFEELRAAFEAAPGHELESKMRAPWSSSALGVNTFAPWIPDLAGLPIVGRTGFERLEFERACSNNVSRYEPHLDVLLTRPAEIVAVESKFTEFLQGSDHSPVAEGYKQLAAQADFRASSRWFVALQHVERFLLLDAYQLVKHYLGLTYTFREENPQLTLVYLYWEPTNPLDCSGSDLFIRHRREIAEFAALVDGDPTCELVPLSYPAYWQQLAELRDTPRWLDAHLELLGKRYLIELL